MKSSTLGAATGALDVAELGGQAGEPGGGMRRVGGRPRGQDLAAELDAIALRCAALPLLDERPEEEILGYDERGLPA